MHFRIAAFALVAIALVAACVGSADSTQVAGTLPDGSLVADLRGARLIVEVSKSVEAGAPLTFKVRLENNRTEPLQNSWNSCFADLHIRVPLPTEPVGRADWTGREAAFKAFALANATLYGGQLASDPLDVEPLSNDCVGDYGLTHPMPPGRSITATFTWKANFDGNLRVPPSTVSFSVAASIYAGHGEVTPPPPPTWPPGAKVFIPGHWFPRMDALTVNGTIDITGTTKPMASIGQVIDGAVADPDFLAFVRSEPFERCTVNILLSGNNGTYLPQGPGWDVEVICDQPRHFIRVEVDPWTAAVVGVDACPDPCAR